MNKIIIGASSDLGITISGSRLAPQKILSNIDTEDNKVILIGQDKDYSKEYDPSNMRKNEKELNKFNEKVYKEIITNVKKDDFFILIGGDHSVSISSALASSNINREIGVIWIDSHADYNTFETTITGNLHGFPLATINGKNKRLSAFHTEKYVDPKKTVIVGYRSKEYNKKDEVNNLKKAGVTYITNKDIKKYGIETAMKVAFYIASNKGNNKVHVSFDNDFIDPLYAPGVSVPEKNGPHLAIVKKVLDSIIDNKDLVASFDLVEFNPLKDIDNKTLNIDVKILKKVLKMKK